MNWRELWQRWFARRMPFAQGESGGADVSMAGRGQAKLINNVVGNVYFIEPTQDAHGQTLAEVLGLYGRMSERARHEARRWAKQEFGSALWASLHRDDLMRVQRYMQAVTKSSAKKMN